MIPDRDVQELLDRSRIADTIYAYCEHVDRADLDAVIDLFVEDGTIDLGAGAIHRGHDEIRDMLVDRFTLYTATSFFCTGVRLVRYDGETASTTTHLQTYHNATRPPRQMQLRGFFEDDLVKVAAGWKFRARHLRVSGMSQGEATEVPPRFSRVGRSPVRQQ